MDFSLALKLYTAEQVKCGEVEAARLAGISMYSLMQRAGMAVYERFQTLYPRAKRVVVLCGKGNNGGDGYVFATLAQQAQLDVSVFQAGKEQELTGDAKLAFQEWVLNDGRHSDWKDWEEALFEADVIIDALLGTGLSGDVKKPFSEYIEQINRIRCPVISIDIPSGLCANTGNVLGHAVKADHTVTFIGVKQGLCTGQARSKVGELHFAGLGVEREFQSTTDESALGIDHKIINRLWPEANPTAHKGDNGKLLCVGGNQGMSGAIRLCASAAVRTGAGLTAAITHPNSLVSLQVSSPEVMSQSVTLEQLKDTDNELVKRAHWSDVLVFGPGMGMDAWSDKVYQQLIDIENAKLVDADGLNLLAKYSIGNSSLSIRDDLRIITPHPGEAARLLNSNIEEIESNRFQAVRALHEQYGGVIVLKGVGTLIYDGSRMYVCLAGNEGMACGGVGDVLSGIIGGLLAKGLPISTAARLGVVIHSCAADENVRTFGRVGLLATDIVNGVRGVINSNL
ncbi:NAD(P)H-hydrate dehydratase [Vibrio rotiferianus]|uniref:NAD(P)H-hydrate dehydratase n=1 Tax=Vibrio rotiferianus TaxID=190895 RepID=UPI00406AACD6